MLHFSVQNNYYQQEKRRHEIDEKVQQSQELEKQVAMQERKDLFQQRKKQKTKIARLASQMELVAMVCCVCVGKFEWVVALLDVLLD